MLYLIPLWIFMYIVYPAWLLPVGANGRLYVLGALAVYFAANGWLCRLWFGTGGERTVSEPQASREPISVRHLLILLPGMVVLTVLHIYPLQFSLWHIDDEAYHVSSPLTLSERISEKIAPHCGYDFLMLVRAGCIAVIILWLLYFLLVRFAICARCIEKIKNIFRKTRVWFLVAGIIALAGYSFAIRSLPYMPGLIRFPPINRILYIIAFSFGGINETAPRVVQMLFSYATAIVLYRLVCLFRPRRTAWWAAAFYLVFPISFYYASVAELGSGTVFFIMLTVLYMLRYLKDACDDDLFKAGISFTAGFFYKREILILLIVFYLVLIGERCAAGKCSLSGILKEIKWGWVITAGCLPLLVLGQIYGMNIYRPHLANWVSFDIMTKYLRQVAWHLTVPGAVLCGISCVWLLLKRKDLLDRFCMMWFIVIYIYFTSDLRPAIELLGGVRVTLIVYPFIALVMADGINTFFNKLKLSRTGVLCMSALAGWFLLAAVLVPCGLNHERYPLYAHHNASNYAAYDEALPFIKENVPAGSRIYDPAHAQHFKFYLYKYDVHMRWFEAEDPPARVMHTDGLLHAFCRKNGIQYLLITRDDIDHAHIRLRGSFLRGGRDLYLWEIL